MYKVLILPSAKQDVREAAEWYEERQKGLGKRFLNEVRSKVAHIRSKPKGTAVRYDDIHCAVLDIFPFMIHFTVDDDLKLVVVSAVFHTSLNPGRWGEER